VLAVLALAYPLLATGCPTLVVQGAGDLSGQSVSAHLIASGAVR
jgi:hypothetical protein